VKLLVSRGANANVEDTFYHAHAIDMALSNGHTDVAIFLLQSGADADGALAGGVQTNNEAIVRAALAGKVTRQGIGIGASDRRRNQTRIPRAADQDRAR
jgi:hypothetical protein